MISTKSAYVAVITITLINGFFSTNMFKKYDNMYKIINYYYFNEEKFYNKEELIKQFGFTNFELCENEILEILYKFKQIESRTILFSESEFILKDTF